MGSLPSLAYATANPIPALVLLAPVLPAGFGANPIELPVDPTAMWMPPPALAGADALIPAQVRLLVKALDATFVLLEGEGHGIIVTPVWREVAIRISEWLSQLERLAG